MRRAAAYYGEHPEKKRTLNQRRYRRVGQAVCGGPGRAEAGEPPAAVSPETAAPQPSAAQDGTGGGLPEQPPRSVAPCSSAQCPPALARILPKAQDPEVMGHVRVIMSVLEHRPVGLEEIWEGLLKISRQRTIGRRRPIDHTLAWLNTHPP